MNIYRLRQIKVDLTSAKKRIEDPIAPSLVMDIVPNPCWPGYEPIGLKDDGSPNCVPKKKLDSEEFVIPQPNSGEKQDEYLGRCISSIIDEYGQEQAAAICYGNWDRK